MLLIFVGNNQYNVNTFLLTFNMFSLIYLYEAVKYLYNIKCMGYIIKFRSVSILCRNVGVYQISSIHQTMRLNKL